MPADRLAEVLAKHPKAVLLSRAEYETLLHDAQREKPTVTPLPREAVISQATYTGEIRDQVAAISGTLTVTALAGEWVQVPLPVGNVSLGAIEVNGESALASGKTAKGADAAGPPMLLLHGRGEHTVKLTFSTPIARKEGGSSLSVKLPAAGASRFELLLPPHSAVTSEQPFSLTEEAAGTRLMASVSARTEALALQWRPAAGALAALPPAVESRTDFHHRCSRHFRRVRAEAHGEHRRAPRHGGNPPA